jgi:predicted Zn-dependent protease
MSTDPSAARQLFEDCAAYLATLIAAGEHYLFSFQSEDSDFVRINRSRVRQAGHVVQRHARVDLIRAQRSVVGTCGLSGSRAADRQTLQALVADLRRQLALVPVDPYLNYSTKILNSEAVRHSELPEPAAALDALQRLGEGLDLVGLWASGHFQRGFANSFGQRNWYSAGSFNLDMSAHLPDGHAVKCRHAGPVWDASVLEQKLAQVRDWVSLMQRPPHALAPGRYRVYLAPHALAELLNVVAYEGFGQRSHKSCETPLLRMVQQGTRLDARVTIQEANAAGFAPRFTSAGFVLPESVPLIEAGVYRDCLVDRRSAIEFGSRVNADAETPHSLSLDGGELAQDAILDALSTGLYLSNLWYTNLSDRGACRLTGTTRFACFWVEDGQIRAPIPTLRFDESLFHFLGDGLIGLTREREFMLDPSTYEARSLASMHLPGALIENFRFVM